MLYLTKRNPDQPFWNYARDAADADLPVVLTELALADDRVVIGPHEARRVLSYLHREGFRDDETPNLRTPVRVVDFDGNPCAP